MSGLQSEFIEFALTHEVLRFGEFTLKSGRTSPYFFNLGAIGTGAGLASLGRFYADAIVSSGVEADLLMGPAYKGIPIAAASAVQLAERHGKDMPWCFNRKEAKDHGEGGLIVGSPLAGRVLLVDDVITAGTAIREAVTIIEDAGAELVGIVVAIFGAAVASAPDQTENCSGSDHLISPLILSQAMKLPMPPWLFGAGYIASVAPT